MVISVIKEIIFESFSRVIYFVFDSSFFLNQQFSWIKAKALSRLFGCQLHETCFIHRGVRFINPKMIIVGPNTSIMYDSIIEARSQVLIGHNCLISPGVLITAGDHDLASLAPTSSPVCIGNNCFIGARATILAGTSIGNNSIVGAGSVVTKDVPTNAVAVGTPARVVKYIEVVDSVWTLSGMRTRK